MGGRRRRGERGNPARSRQQRGFDLGRGRRGSPADRGSANERREGREQSNLSTSCFEERGGGVGYRRFPGYYCFDRRATHERFAGDQRSRNDHAADRRRNLRDRRRRGRMERWTDGQLDRKHGRLRRGGIGAGALSDDAVRRQRGRGLLRVSGVSERRDGVEHVSHPVAQADRE